MEHNIEFYKDKDTFLEAWVCDCEIAPYIRCYYSAYTQTMVIILK